MNNKCAEANDVKTQNIFMSKIALTPKGSISATSQEVKDFGAKPEGVGFFSYWHLHQYIIIILILSCQSAFAEPVYLKASWYSIESLKREGTYEYSKGIMADGKAFDENNLTCACRIYPLGTLLRITNISNGKSVQAKVTDRIGKRFAKTRIDLSKRAFLELADLSTGIIQVKITQVK